MYHHKTLPSPSYVVIHRVSPLLLPRKKKKILCCCMCVCVCGVCVYISVCINFAIGEGWHILDVSDLVAAVYSASVCWGPWHESEGFNSIMSALRNTVHRYCILGNTVADRGGVGGGKGEGGKGDCWTRTNPPFWQQNTILLYDRCLGWGLLKFCLSHACSHIKNPLPQILHPPL